MKVKVLQRFRDKYNHVTRYEVGTEHEFENERAADLIERGLVEAVEETPPADTLKDGNDVAGKGEGSEGSEVKVTEPATVGPEPVKAEEPAEAPKAKSKSKSSEK
ncbi:hypothetical protein SAMN05216364_100616 [Porphyromonadaceae bacterium KHP3R9]|nr:hypothetical protein SAMN05216364_100616 [Porphyromonadaceae bacterium KHP3R9]